MKLRERWRAWRLRRRRQKALASRETPLREFVYLDEVSVYSLIASRVGPVAAELTETGSASFRTQFDSKVSGDAKVLKGELGSTSEQTNTTGTQVVRKSIVQATFKELRDSEQDYLVIRPPEANDDFPQPENSVVNPQLLGDLRSTVWVTEESACVRGGLIEIDVELEADPIFRVSTVISSLSQMFSENAQLFRGVHEAGFGQAVSINRMLTRLLAGLVPIRGKAASYKVIEEDGLRYIVHNDILAQLPLADREKATSLMVVGVADESLFWKDVRRVLFSNSQYRVLCRISRPGLHDSWTPVKLADVLGELDPDLKGQLDILGEGALSAMSQATRQAQQRSLDTSSMSIALRLFCSSIAERSAVELTQADLEHLSSLALGHAASNSSIEDRRVVFRQALDYLRETYSISIDPTTAAHERMAAMVEAGISPTGTQEAGLDLVALAANPARSALHLDTEVIAIYW